MHQLSLQLPNSVITPIKNLLRQQLKDKNNLIYFASGKRIREGYEGLPYDNVVLVDKSFKETVSINGKIICIGLDSVQATALFKSISVKFSAICCINEGLAEGGGFFAVQSNWSLTNILPIMHDEYIHIACPEYYGQRKWKKYFNLPQEATLLDEHDADYINPHMFSDYYKYGKEFCVWKVKKKASEPVSFKHGSRKITVQRKNIWEDYDVLDSLFVRCSPIEAKNLKNVAPKAEILKNYTFEQILKFCTRNQIKSIGLSPWLRHNYNGFLNFIKENDKKYFFPQTLNFYHVNAGDFKQLYDLAEQQQPT
ncbi:hypothetical protein [Pontibacter sp. H249]|uniref:hypothetical protein n=1 Tax=Pontibacter sp. H249 TaxID=3133420 RepID=UPI0030BF73BF